MSTPIRLPALGLRDSARLIAAMTQDYLGALQDAQQRHGDLVYLRQLRLLFVFDLDAARQVLSDPDWLKGRHNARAVLQLAGRNLQVMEGDQWRRNRTVLEAEYSPRTFAPFLDAADLVVTRWLQRLRGINTGEALDMHAELQHLMLQVVNSMYLGLPEHGLSAVAPAYLDLVAAEFMRHVSRPGWGAYRRLPLPASRRDRSAVQQLDRMLQPHVAATEQRCSDAEAFLTADEQLDHARGLLLGSTLGLGLSILWALYHLCHAPHHQVRLRQAIDDARTGGLELGPSTLAALPVARQVHLEAMRLMPPAHTLERHASRATVVAGRAVPAGTSVLVPIHTIHRDSRLWAHPDTFDPERFGGDGWPTSRAFLPFGLGARSCVARRLSMSIGSLVLTRLIDEFVLELEPGFRPVVWLNPEISTSNGMRMLVHSRSTATKDATWNTPARP